MLGVAFNHIKCKANGKTDCLAKEGTIKPNLPFLLVPLLICDFMVFGPAVYGFLGPFSSVSLSYIVQLL